MISRKIRSQKGMFFYTGRILYRADKFARKFGDKWRK